MVSKAKPIKKESKQKRSITIDPKHTKAIHAIMAKSLSAGKAVSFSQVLNNLVATGLRHTK